jgi:hypothetical protein
MLCTLKFFPNTVTNIAGADPDEVQWGCPNHLLGQQYIFMLILAKKLELSFNYRTTMYSIKRMSPVTWRICDAENTRFKTKHACNIIPVIC